MSTRYSAIWPRSTLTRLPITSSPVMLRSVRAARATPSSTASRNPSGRGGNDLRHPRDCHVTRVAERATFRKQPAAPRDRARPGSCESEGASWPSSCSRAATCAPRCRAQRAHGGGRRVRRRAGRRHRGRSTRARSAPSPTPSTIWPAPPRCRCAGRGPLPEDGRRRSPRDVPGRRARGADPHRHVLRGRRPRRRRGALGVRRRRHRRPRHRDAPPGARGRARGGRPPLLPRRSGQRHPHRRLRAPRWTRTSAPTLRLRTPVGIRRPSPCAASCHRAASGARSAATCC